MRTLAVALVLVGHSWVRHFHGADLGVGLFFALSGFLITGLLMDELGRHGRVDLARFTGRRALRLVPALMVLLAATVPVLCPPSGDVAAALLYYSNWWRAAGHDMGNLGHLWSLAVEEQFYLVWPLILVVAAPLGRARGVLAVAVALCLTAPVIRALAGEDYPRVSNGLDTRMDALMAGAVLALAHRLWPR